jgi:hypothetical protein
MDCPNALVVFLLLWRVSQSPSRARTAQRQVRLPHTFRARIARPFCSYAAPAKEDLAEPLSSLMLRKVMFTTLALGPLSHGQFIS